MKIDPVTDAVIQTPGECVACGGRMPKSAVSERYCNKCVKKAGQSRIDGEKAPAEMAAAASRELAVRELCRRRLLPYTQKIKPDYLAGWFHKDLAARLERFVYRVEKKESPRLIINVPPRRGKSELASKAMLAWALGRNPSFGIISATHSDRLAVDNSRDVLSYVRDPNSRLIFPDLDLAKEQKGATGWRTTGKGAYKPVGVGAGIAGYGAHILDIDDPHRDRDAFSPTVRDNIWRWYSSSARTRLMPGGGILLIQTRWVFDDLTGRVLEDEGLLHEGGIWEQVVYPEEATRDEYRLPNGRVVYEPLPGAQLLRKEGEILHPERWNPEENEQHKKDPATWAALYQQDPSAGDAAIFTAAALDACECELADIPKNLTHYSAWDTALGQKERHDWTVEIVGGLDQDGVLWIKHVERGRWETTDIVDMIIASWREYRQDLIGVEKTAQGIAIESILNREVTRQKAWGIEVEYLEHGNKDKTLRARPIQAMVNRQQVRIPRDAPWYAAFRKELLENLGGKHDDQVDTFAYLGQMISEMNAPRAPREEQSTSWRDRLDRFVGAGARDWRVA